jgi:hypothetical protein
LNIQAKLPAGSTRITVHGLHQWDYGRKLEIKSASLAGRAVVEVHFASAGMTKAIVRTCDVSLQTTTAAIPDTCLEQTAPVLAWVFCPDETEGFTVIEITMPVTARTKPSDLPTTPPSSYSNQYLDLISAAQSVINSTYTKAEIDAALGVYITDLNALIGGDA